MWKKTLGNILRNFSNTQEGHKRGEDIRTPTRDCDSFIEDKYANHLILTLIIIIIIINLTYLS